MNDLDEKAIERAALALYERHSMYGWPTSDAEYRDDVRAILAALTTATHHSDCEHPTHPCECGAAPTVNGFCTCFDDRMGRTADCGIRAHRAAAHEVTPDV